jgi:hypothetical protein
VSFCLCGLARFKLIIYAVQYNAWCWNDGDHKTPKRGKVNWNSELCEPIRNDLDDVLDEMQRRSEEVLNDLPIFYQGELNKLLVTMKGTVVIYLFYVLCKVTNSIQR